MPRSYGGGGVKRNVVMSTGLSAVTKDIERLARDSNSCQVVFDRYEECVETEHLYGAGTCDFFRELRASCSRFKRDPRHQNVVERQKQWAESTQRRATAAGFATIDEYLRDKHSKDPAMCRIAFRLYNECIREDPTDKVCDVHRLNCRQFRS
ncbi:hypothetical protein RHSIM_Rhsim07G0251500 [Rhododendron simsii]|uniref:Uncharacterized protein n=1 Tax=Rhododendron simsii TaxID=118357 RepID=A0A834LGE7_RHOSS|nr:hypothetical protein RHSIM_Rhsim07G0251500 [Rhododendron simsii]